MKSGPVTLGLYVVTTKRIESAKRKFNAKLNSHLSEFSSSNALSKFAAGFNGLNVWL